MDFLDPSRDAFFRIFEIEGGVPFGTGSDFNSSVIPVLLLEFQDQFNGITLHLAFGENNLWNLFDSLIGIAFLVALQPFVILYFLAEAPALLELIRLGIDHDRIGILF
jgi:hypothetical protein